MHPVISSAHIEPLVDPMEDLFQGPFAQRLTMKMVLERIQRRREQTRLNEKN